MILFMCFVVSLIYNPFPTSAEWWTCQDPGHIIFKHKGLAQPFFQLVAQLVRRVSMEASKCIVPGLHHAPNGLFKIQGVA